MGRLMVERHGGNIRRLAETAGRTAGDLIDFSANINPLGPPEWLRPLISSRIESLVHYPDPDCGLLTKAASNFYRVKPDEVLLGNGSTEILYQIPRSVPRKRAVIPSPAYADYATAADLCGLQVVRLVLKEENGFRLGLGELEKHLEGDEIVFIGQPNNPTGLLCPTELLRELARRNPSTLFVIDEAFADFVEGLDRMTQKRPPNVFVLLSLTKFYAIPGLRLGCAVGDPALVREIRRFIPPWSVNALAQAVGEAALNDGPYASRSRGTVRKLRKELVEDLHSISGLTVYPGEANFLLVRLGRGMPASPLLGEELLREGIAIRVCTNFTGLDERFFRVAVRTEEENERLIASLRRALGQSAKIKRARKIPAVMFQGTSSNAGKSVLTAALCRILLQDGYRVAPFKAQNMSLNSYVTHTGGEMGRAQVVQAQACRLEPEVRMNPILLKPSSDTGAQVILMGQPVGNMDVGEYVWYKPQAFKAVREAFDSLAEEFDVVVLEGAGSPAEVNLKSHDIVNMQMARYARCPVLLVGDIDRGGVFASFVGTMEVLAEWERKLVAGFIINRFRGEEALLADAFEYTRRHTGLPTFGVVPHVQDLGLPEEDSVSFKSSPQQSIPPSEAVEVAVVDLPHISNFTDFDSLRVEPDVHVRTIRRLEDLNQPDAVILPGSKNVIGDLEYLRQRGLDRRIADLARQGRTEIIGLCGGLQILGAEIADPYGLESCGKTLTGLGLLPLTTVLERGKTLKSVSGKHAPSGIPVKGYEIHHGKTEGMNLVPVVLRDDGEVIGSGGPGQMIWGTYLHGIFDTDPFRRWFIDRLRGRKGLPPVGRILASYDLEPAFERLAGIVRRKVRIKDIYRLMGL